jgi:hypothetical protein
VTAVWTPGTSGPLDELVVRIRTLVESFARAHELEQAEVRVELVDGRELLVSSISAEPGFGFLSLVPHVEAAEEPRQVIVPVGAIRLVEISPPDPKRPFGFALS